MTPVRFLAIPFVLALFVTPACAPQVTRGGEGTANPDLDRAALRRSRYSATR